MPALLSSQRLESDAFETRHFGLEDAKVDERRAAVVLAGDILDGRPLDLEEGHASAAYALHMHVHHFGTSGKGQGAQEKVVRADHGVLPSMDP
jgi:hypothetical protein